MPVRTLEPASRLVMRQQCSVQARVGMDSDPADPDGIKRDRDLLLRHGLDMATEAMSCDAEAAVLKQRAITTSRTLLQPRAAAAFNRSHFLTLQEERELLKASHAETTAYLRHLRQIQKLVAACLAINGEATIAELWRRRQVALQQRDTPGVITDARQR